MGFSPLNLDWVVVPLARGRTVLDVAFGAGKWGSLLRTNHQEAGMGEPPIVDGIDAFQPNVDAVAGLGIYRRVWRHVLPDPLEGTWDTVLACEVLEHLESDQVAATLDVLEAAAERRVIVSSPNGPDFRSGLDTAHGYNEHEAHRTFVPRSTLKSRGYRILGAGFGPPGSLLSRFDRKTRLGRDLASLSLHVPALGAAYVAYKDVAGR
jgi:hypothetical protein